MTLKQLNKLLYDCYSSETCYPKIKDEWNNKYFPKLDITIQTDLTIDGSGSLNNSIEEVQS